MFAPPNLFMNATTNVSRNDLIEATMGKHKWIQKSISHPGATRAAAKREGLSTREWAQKHKHDPGTKGKRAREALELENMHHK